MPCQSVTVTAPSTNIQFASFSASGGQNEVVVDFALEDANGVGGNQTVSVSVDLGADGSVDASDTFDYSVPASGTVSDSIVFTFNMSADDTAQACANLV